MKFTLPKLQEHFPDLNKREITEAECWEFCERHNVHVRRAPLVVDGYCGSLKSKGRKQNFIFLNEKLSPIEHLAVFLHEIGHVILHDPRGSKAVLYHRRDNAAETKQDIEADMFMLLGILPLYRFQELSRMPADFLHPFTIDLLQKRQKLFEKIGV